MWEAHLPTILANDRLSNKTKLCSERNVPPVPPAHLTAKRTRGTRGFGWPVRVVSIREHAEKRDARAQTYPKSRVVRVEAFVRANVAGRLRHCYEQIEGCNVFGEEVGE